LPKRSSHAQGRADTLSFWTSLVDALGQGMIVTGRALGGSTAAGIFAATFILRLLLIPLMLPLSVRTRERQKVFRTIKPEIKAIHERYKDDPGGMSRELKKVHQDAGIEVIDWSGLGLAAIQLPILIALFQAVLEISERSALAEAGLVPGLAASALAVVGTKASGQSDGAPWLLWLSGVLPVAIALWLGAGIGLYLMAFYAAAAVQAWIMPKDS